MNRLINAVREPRYSSSSRGFDRTHPSVPLHISWKVMSSWVIPTRCSCSYPPSFKSNCFHGFKFLLVRATATNRGVTVSISPFRRQRAYCICSLYKDGQVLACHLVLPYIQLFHSRREFPVNTFTGTAHNSSKKCTPSALGCGSVRQSTYQ